MDPVILSTAYLAPVQYYSKLLNRKTVIEQYDSYMKQTYRNRCRVLTGNGVENLTIPVVRPNGNNTLVKDVKLDNSRKWQLQHWRTLMVAYNNTPFFEFYADEFLPFYTSAYHYLIDFNDGLQQVVIQALSMETDYSYSDVYLESKKHDYRDRIHPKKKYPDPEFKEVEYYQVFGGRFGFIPGLSIVDLLFNCGPESLLVLKKTLDV